MENNQIEPKNFVGLISGGKDSIFNILECVKRGHKLIVLINLYYPDDGKEEDSYMYQSVGSNMASLIAEAMEIPLIRREIKGKPIIQDLTYKGSQEQKKDDEVEDLYEALKECKEKYPQIQAVSTGAIASTYQKLRVQNVCQRLGLTCNSIGYLWGRDQTELLTSMIENNMHAILIKVASFGLGKKQLGKSLKDNYDDFMKMKEQFQLNVCGEGGEYETITLDCPLYKKRIEIVDSEIITHSDDQFAPVYYLKIKKAILVDKENIKN